jgi:transcriptional regulator with XRE-family HTH domain
MTLGERIKRLRLSKNMSQARFGSKLGISGKSISAYENDLCVPSLRVMESMSSTYDVSFIPENNKQNISKKIQDLKKYLIELESILENTLSL